VTLDRSRPPGPAAARPFHFPDWQGRRLANGVRVMVAAEPSVPLVHLELLLARGADSDPLPRRGLTPLAAGLLDEGTESLDSAAIADRVERLGASLSTSGDWDGVSVAVSALAEHLPAVLALAAEVARRPTFPPDELERLRRSRLADLANRARQPAFVAGRHAAALLYGPDHPYGESLLGTSESVAAIERDDVVAWHRGCARPTLATLVAVGDTTLDAVTELAERALGDWAADGTAAAAPAPGPPRAVAARRLRVVDRPGAAQTELRLTRVGLPRAAPEHLAGKLLSLILGGKFTSRLNLNLRERRGITYGVHSRLSGRRGSGPFTVQCAVDTAATGLAATEILAELDRLRGEEPPEEEVRDARNYLLGTFPYRLQGLDELADHLAELALHDLPTDHFATLPRRIAELPIAALRDCAARLLRSDDAVLVAVGPAAELRGQLEPLGPVEVVPAETAATAS
jgi:zinc protease